MRFKPGRVVVWRHFHGSVLALLKTARVVADDERGLLLWIPQQSPMLDRRFHDGRGLRSVRFEEWVAGPTTLFPARWEGPGVLKLLPPGAAHSIWFMWHRDGTFRAWYVNLEETGVRWDDGDAAGVDVCDQDLDVWVEPDRSWRWKDEEEFAERLAIAEGYWVRDASAVRAEGLRVIAQVTAGVFPFDGTWLDVYPRATGPERSDWLVPDQVPGGWQRPRAEMEVE